MAVALLPSVSARSVTLTWDADGTTAGQVDGAGEWTAADLWWDIANNVTWTSGSDANFGLGGAGGDVTLASPTTVNSLTFNTFTGTYTLGSSAQAMTLNSGITMNAGAGAVSIISPVTLGGAQSWTNNSSSLLTVSGDITNGANLLTIGGSGNTTLSGIIGNGTGGLTKSGAGTLVLSGTNTFSGAVSINGGVLSIGASANLGDASATNTLALAGGTLRSTGTGNVDLTSNRAITLGVGGGTFDVGGTAGDFLSLTGTITGTSTLTKIGTGSLSLAADNSATFSGAIDINSGLLNLGHVSGLGTGTVTVKSSAILQVAATNAKLGNVVVQSGGVLRLSQPQDSTAGALIPTTPISGILEIRNATVGANFDGIQMAAGSTVRSNLAGVNYGSDLILNGAVDFDTVNQNFTISGALSGAFGAITKISANTLTLSGTNTFSGLVTINGGTLSVSAPGNLGDASATNTIALGGGTLRSTATMDLGATRTIAVGTGGGALSAQTGTVLTVSGALSGTGTLSAAGGGTVVLTANNSGFGGNFTVDSVSGNTTNTTLRPSGLNSLPASTIITVNPGAAASGGNGNQVELTGQSIGSGVSLVLNTLSTGNARSSLLASSGTSTWAGGIQFGGDGAPALNVASGATLNVNGNITAAGGGYTGTAFLRGTGTGVINGTINLPAGTIAKTDGGSWTINSAGNTWLNTTVAVGTLKLGIANALPSTTAVTLGQNDGNSPTLELNGFGQTITSLATNPTTGLTGTKTVTSATAATLTINGSANTIYAGVVTGALSLVKSGTGTQTFTGANSYTGGITLNSGTLNVNTVGTAANGPLGNGGTFTINGGVIDNTSGSAKVVANVNPITLGGDFAFSTSAGTANNNLTLPGAISMAADRVITLNGLGALTLSGKLINTGDSVRTLTVNNGTGTGATSLLTIGGYDLTGPGSTAPRNNIINGTGNVTISGIVADGVSAGSGLTVAGSGTLILSGPNTYTGPTTINSGSVLTIQHGMALGSTVGGTSVPSGAALHIQGGAGVGAEPLALSGTGISNAGALRNISGGNSYGGLVTLGSATRINSDAGLLTWDVASGNAVTGAFDLTFGGAGNISVADPIATGIGSVTKDGAGTLILSGANTYSGATTVSEGTLQFTNQTSLYNGTTASWTAANINVKSGATLALNVDSAGTNGFSAASLNTLLTNISVANTASEGLQAGAILALNTSTATGATFTQGNAIANSTGAFGGAIGLTKLGTGTLVLDKVNSYTGSTVINAGTVTVNRQTGSLDSASGLTFTGTGIFNMDNTGAGGALSQNLGALTFSAGDGTVRTTRTAAFDQAITFASLAARTAGATGNFVNTGTNIATNGFVFTTAPTVGALIDHGLFYNGFAYATYDAGGFVRGFGAGDTDYLDAPAGATIGASTSASNVDLSTGNITAQTTASANTINMRSSSITMSGTSQVLSVNGLLSSGSAAAAIGGGTTPLLQVGTPGGELVVRVNGASDVLTITSVIQNNTSASSLTKTGDGTLNLNSVNTFTGAININSGTLKYGSGSATIAGNITIGSGATLNGGTGLGANLTFSGTILNNGAIIRTANGTSIFNNVISGTGSVSNGAAGKLELNASNTFSGGVTQAGDASANNFMTLGNPGALGTGTFTIASAGEVRSSVVNLVNANNNPILLNSNFTFAGSNNANLGSGAVTLSGSRTLTVTNTLTLGGVIGETGGARSLTKAGSGTLVLGGAGSTYSGGTTISAGTLRLGASNVLLDAGAVTVVGGTLDIQNFSDTIGALTLTSGSIAGTTGVLTCTSYNVQSGTVSAILGGTGVAVSKTTGGTVTLSGPNTYTGATTVSAGILTFANPASLYTGNTANWTAANINVKAGGTLAVNVDSAGASGFDATKLTTLLTNISVANDAAFGLQAAASIGFDTGTATGATFTLPNALADSTGAFGGSIGLAKLGAGTLVLDKANTNTGPTAIYAGTLQLENTGAISAALLLNNGSFVVNKSGALAQGTDFPSIMVGSGSLTYAGGGTLTLNAANTYSGNTTVSSGTLALTNALALQNSALVTTSGAVTVTPTTLTLGGLSGATGDLASVISSGYGSVTALTLNPGTGVTNSYGGAIADGAPGMTLIKTGAGTQVLQGANTYTGATTVNAGTLTLSGATGSISSTSIVLNGGVFTLDNSSTTGGNLGTRVSDSAAVNVSGNSALRFTHNAAAATNYAETINTLALQSGFLTYTGSQAAASQTSSLNFNTLTRSGTATVNFAGTGLGADARNTVMFGAGVTAGTDLGPWAVVNGADFATYDATLGVKAAANTTLAAGSNSNSTNFRMTGGGITITASLNPSYKTLLVSDTTARTLAINGNTVSVGGISTAGQAHIISGTGAVQALAAGDPLYINVGNNTLTISSVIQNVGAGATASALVKYGSGTLILSNASNTYSGGTIISGGVIQVGSSGNNPADTVFGNTSGSITLDGGQLKVLSSNLSSVRSVIVAPAGGSVAVNGNNNFTTTGKLTGSGQLTFIDVGGAGGRQLNFYATNNDFTGAITVPNSTSSDMTIRFKSLGDASGAGNIRFTSNGGKLEWATGAVPLVLDYRQIELAGSAGPSIINNSSSTITINTDLLVTASGNKTLTLAGSNTGNNRFAGRINDVPGAAISVTKSDGGTWTLSGNNTFSGGLTLSGATANSQLNINSATALGTGTFTISGGDNAKINNTSGGAITLTTNNAQVWNNNFTFTGTHDLNMGVGPVTLGGNRALTVGGTLTVGGSISGAFTLTKGGGGTLVLSGQSTYSGATNINQGILSINSLADFGSNSALGAPTSGSIRLGSGALSGTLLYTGAGHNSNRTFQIGDGTAANTGSGTISNDGSGELILTAPSFNPVISGITATRSLTLGGTSTGFVNAIQGVIQDNNGATGKVNLVKTDASTWALAGTNTYTGATAVNAGTLRVDGSVATSTGVTVATGATFTAGATQVVKTLDLSAASSNASILAGAIRVLSVGDNTAASPLTLTGGKMDLNTSALIVDFTAGNEAANLTAMKTAILAGRGTGVWDGTSGLTSTAAAAASTVYGVGYAPSSIATGAIAGVTPDADAVVARYTRLGDANLDGAVNFFDLTALAAAYGGAGEWYNGDFDYSGTINFFDLTALAANYGTGLPSEAIPGATPEFSADLAAAFASVPEPGAISLLGLAALALLRRSTRRRNAA